MAKKKARNNKRLGWHFLPEDMTLGYNDGRKAKVGKTLAMEMPGAPTVCERGMHASDKISQAADFKKGPVLCRVEVWGDIHVRSDKFCGRFRKVLWAKKIPKQIFSKIFKATGVCPLGTADEALVNALSSAAYMNPSKVDSILEDWAMKNGCDTARVDTKPAMALKDVEEALSRRYVKTRRELMKSLSDAGFDMSSFSDAMENIDEGYDPGRVIIVEDYNNGSNGYILKLR